MPKRAIRVVRVEANPAVISALRMSGAGAQYNITHRRFLTDLFDNYHTQILDQAESDARLGPNQAWPKLSLAEIEA